MCVKLFSSSIARCHSDDQNDDDADENYDEEGDDGEDDDNENNDEVDEGDDGVALCDDGGVGGGCLLKRGMYQ